MYLLIQHKTCPRCANKLTADLFGWGMHCFNCGTNLPTPRRELARRVVAPDEWMSLLMSEAGMVAAGEVALAP